MAQVTMRHIAALADVSVMTVSRALKDNPRISAATRQRIQKLAKELGYKTHPYISALMSDLSRTQHISTRVNLAVLHYDKPEKTKRHEYYQGIVRRAQETGYSISLFHYDPINVPPDRLRSILRSRGIRGIIIMPALAGSTSVDFDFRGFAAVTLGHTIISPPLPRVASDIYGSSFQALDELVARGYRRIGLVITASVNRLGSFLYSASIQTYGSYVRPELHLAEHTLAEPAQSPASLRKMKRWIIDQKLDAVICPEFDVLLYDILIRQGFRIPQDLGYLHLLNYPNPRVSSLSQQGLLMGAKAVDLVVATINRNEFEPPTSPQTLTILTRWEDGETTPHRRPPAHV